MELVGVREAAALLGWDRRKVSVYVARGKLPPPLARLRSGPVWDRRAIEAFARGEAPSVAEGNTPEAEAMRAELADLERRIAERRRELAGLERKARRTGGVLPKATDLGRQAEELLAVGTAVWSAAAAAGMIASGSSPWQDEAFDRHQFAALAMRLGVEQSIARLLTWREGVWPPGAREALDAAMAALGPEYRIRGWRLQRKHNDKWRPIQLT